MDRTEFLNKLEALHDRIRVGEVLPEAELRWYREARERLLALAVEVQARASAGDQKLRSSIRMGTVLPVRLETGGWTMLTITADIGAGGFAVIMEVPPPAGREVRATLSPRRGEPVIGVAQVVDSKELDGLTRVGFGFKDPAGAVRDRMEDVMLDGILDQLVFWDDVLGKVNV